MYLPKFILMLIIFFTGISNLSLNAKRLSPNASECEKECDEDCFMEKLEDKDKCVYKEFKCIEKCESEIKSKQSKEQDLNKESEDKTTKDEE